MEGMASFSEGLGFECNYCCDSGRNMTADVSHGAGASYECGRILPGVAR